MCGNFHRRDRQRDRNLNEQSARREDFFEAHSK
jgi:hypothetical protein